MVCFILEMERGMGDSYCLCTCAFFVEPLRQVKAIRSPEYGVKSKAPFGDPERQPAISGIFRQPRSQHCLQPPPSHRRSSSLRSPPSSCSLALQSVLHCPFTSRTASQRFNALRRTTGLLRVLDASYCYPLVRDGPFLFVPPPIHTSFVICVQDADVRPDGTPLTCHLR